ncbi:MAG: hypothetical protein LBO79_01715 [Zoogloeaceae bacterium]|jgi:hypothetical protein|nr:hypothetical protein [Zoogloeaceae bacterium]
MSAQPLIAVLDNGTYFHHRTLHTPEFAPYFNRVIYARELDAAAVAGCDALIVLDRTNPELLIAHRQLFADFLAADKTLVVLGESNPELWLDGVESIPCPTNFWWWLTPGADSGLRLAAPEHPLFRHMTLADATWHQHATFRLPPGARSLVEIADAGSILYEEIRPGAGRLIVTSLDPAYHHGSYFMPATTRFLRGFLSWLRESLSLQRAPAAGMENVAA